MVAWILLSGLAASVLLIVGTIALSARGRSGRRIRRTAVAAAPGTDGSSNPAIFFDGNGSDCAPGASCDGGAGGGGGD